MALSVRCTDVYVEVGDTVSAGQAICKLDISATMANYETASMSYDNAKKSYAEQSSLLSQQVAQAEKNVSDTQALFDMGAASQAELDSAKLSLENAKASMTLRWTNWKWGCRIIRRPWNSSKHPWRMWTATAMWRRHFRHHSLFIGGGKRVRLPQCTCGDH